MPAHEIRKHTVVALLVGLLGWLIPGSGHLLLRQWGRGVGVFLTVGALAGIAMAVRGRLFLLATNDFFDLLGFVADCGMGLFFYVAQNWSNGGPDVAHAAGDYGTRFFAAAGVLNVLAAVDAYRIARGQEEADEDEEEPKAEGVPAQAVEQSGTDPASELRLDPNGAPETESPASDEAPRTTDP